MSKVLSFTGVVLFLTVGMFVFANDKEVKQTSSPSANVISSSNVVSGNVLILPDPIKNTTPAGK